MKKLRRFLCALMCTVLCTGMVQPMLAEDTAEAVNNGAGGTVIKDAYNPFDVIDAANYDIWLYESAETLNNKADSFAALNPTVVKSGSTERTLETKFVEDPVYGVKCVTTVYEPIRKEYGYYRFTTYNAGNNRLSVDLNYIAITYMTPAKGEYQLKFLNSGGDGTVVFTHNTSVSKGKWTTAYVKVDGENKTNIMNRLNNGGGNMRLVWGSTTEGEELYVREIVFFKNEADVKTYAEVAPAYYNGEDIVVKLPRSEEYERKLMLMASVIAAMRGARWNLEEDRRTTNPLEWLDYAVLWNWRSNSEVLKGIDGFQNVSSAVSYVEYNNNSALKLEYTNDANYTETRGYYRLMFTPIKPSTFDISKDYYAAITYRSNKKSELKFFNAGGSSDPSYTGPGEAIFDIVNTEESWDTDYVKIEAKSKLLDRLVNPNTLTLRWSNQDQDGELYISEIVFFEAESSAQDYCKYAEIYYNNLVEEEKAPTNPLDKIEGEIVFDFSDKTLAQKMLYLQDDVNIKTSAWVDAQIDGVSATKFDGLPTSGGYPRCYRMYMFTNAAARSLFAKKAGKDLYIAVTYMCDGNAPLTFKHGAGADQVTFGTTSSSAAWQSMAFNAPITPNLRGRLDGTGAGDTVVLQWETLEANKSFYIKEMVFFDSLADAEKYAENAPKYYNYLAGYKSAVPAPLANIDSDNYDIWLYESADTLLNGTDSFAYLNNTTVDLDGDSTKDVTCDENRFTTDPVFGVKCMSLIYEPLAPQFGNYRFTTSQSKANSLSIDDLNYIALTYMTPNSEKHSIVFKNSGGSGSVTFTENTSESKGRWITVCVPVEGQNKTDIMARINRIDNSGGNMRFEWSNKDENAKMYIREIVFFKNKADAEAYTAAAPAYYNQMPEVVPTYDENPLDSIEGEIVWDLSSESSMKQVFSLDGGYKIGYDCNSGINSTTFNMTNSTSPYVEATRRYVDCLEVKEHPGTTSNGADRTNNKLNFFNTDSAKAKFTGETYYVAITYVSTGKAKLSLGVGNNGSASDYSPMVFASQTEASNVWTTAIGCNASGTPAVVDKYLLQTIKTDRHDGLDAGKTTRVSLNWENTNTALSIYIKEVVFFTSLEDAQAYAEKAPVYYNNYNK